MSSEPAVELRAVGKRYERGQLASLTRTLQGFRVLVGGHRPKRKMFEALHEVTFDIERGECLALLGENGSGKTTLASIISGLTVPSSGQVIVRGRVIPLFNLTTGWFQEELSGRENIELLGTMLGLARRERRGAVPAIADFAEIEEEALETPVFRFSQGMKARLAFAVALRLPADVYIYDEVLAVADDHFKEKCGREIERLVGEGRSVLFVSHELSLMSEVCARGVWLHRGRVRMDGPIDEVTASYAEHEAHAAQLA